MSPWILLILFNYLFKESMTNYEVKKELDLTNSLSKVTISEKFFRKVEELQFSKIWSRVYYNVKTDSRKNHKEQQKPYVNKFTKAVLKGYGRFTLRKCLNLQCIIEQIGQLWASFSLCTSSLLGILLKNTCWIFRFSLPNSNFIA